MWFFDGSAGPGWHDYLGLLVAVAGFAVAIVEIVRTRKATDRATSALGDAQVQLQKRSLLVIVPDLQRVVVDLAYCLQSSDREVAQRTLVGFSLTAREAAAVLSSMTGATEADLASRFRQASVDASQVKADIVTSNGGLPKRLKAVYMEIDQLSHEMKELASSIRMNIEGAEHVHP